MKNLYPKGKGKIHPSPAATGSAAPSSGEAALAVLKLLPLAILALTAALGFEDKEVVAYLMTRSMNGPAAEAAEERRRCRRIAGVHRPLFDCGCFDCYTCFWSRWDCSPNREVIHEAIEAFEEHLARSEKSGAGAAGGGRGRRRDRRAEKGKNSRKKAVEEVRVEAEESKGFEEVAVSLSEEFSADKKEEESEEAKSEVDLTVAALSGERRRGWADVVGIFNSRFWSLWSPGA